MSDHITLDELQRQSGEWRDKNFPGHTAEEAIFGMVEEMGELAHAYLKRKQNIRGTAEEHTAAIKDAVADWIIFACGLAQKEGFSIAEVVTETWEQVRARDWVASPLDGAA